MKGFKILLSCIVFSFVPLSGISAFTERDVNLRMQRFAQSFSATVVNSATQQNAYALSWIGELFPSRPPHLGFGVDLTTTRLDFSMIKEITELFEITSAPSEFLFPVLEFNLRLGGFAALPFDLGLSFMMLDITELKILDGLGLNYFTLGADMRWAVLKGVGVMPIISLGVGYFYSNGHFFYLNNGLATSFRYESHTLYAQVQISKTFAFVSPYVGFRGIVSQGHVIAAWSASKALFDRIVLAKKYTGQKNTSTIAVASNFFDSIIPQIYGGMGFQFSVVNISIGGSWDFINSIWAANASFRFQF